MDRSLLEHVVPFLAVAEHLSFTRAAARLGVTPTAVSKAIRQLETRHHVILFQRTTRSVALTEAGAALFRRLRRATDEIGDAFAVLDGYQDRPTGTLRLGLSRLVMGLLIEPLIAEFRESFPDVALELSLNDGAFDLTKCNCDAGVRLGETFEKDTSAVRLTPEVTWSVVGSPEYFAKAGRPRDPEDLIKHEAVLYKFTPSGAPSRWEFIRGSHEFSVEMRSNIIINDRSSLINLARQGLGLAYVTDVEAGADLVAGRLESVLRDFIPADSGFYLYFPSGAQNQPKLRAFIDLATRALSRPTFLETWQARQTEQA